MEHYLPVIDADFERASRSGAESGAQLPQQARDGSRTDWQKNKSP